MSKRTLMTVTQAAEALGVTRGAIHWHLNHNDRLYVESIGDAEGRAAAMYLVDLDELRQVVKGGGAELEAEPR